MTQPSGLHTWLAPCLLMAACAPRPAPASPPVAQTSGGGATHHAAGGVHHAPSFPAGPVAEMWDALRPLTHGRAGSVPAERDGRICAPVDTLRQRANALAAAPVPARAESRAEAWRTGTTRLVREADALVTACADPARAAVFERLEALHGAFHELTEDLAPCNLQRPSRRPAGRDGRCRGRQESLTLRRWV